MFNLIPSWLIAALGFGADIITASIGTAGNVGSTAAELSTYISAKTLDVAILNTILDQAGEKEVLPDRSSKTIRFTRFEKLTTTTAPVQLTEGVTPDAVGLAVNQFEALIRRNSYVN